jgi:hypothetical protein
MMTGGRTGNRHHVQSSVPFRQQQTGIRATPIDGLKNGLKSPGCKRILAALGRQRKEENQTFSKAYIHQWKLLEHTLSFHGAALLRMTRWEARGFSRHFYTAISNFVDKPVLETHMGCTLFVL